MIPRNRTATHPGTILLKEFLEPMDLTQKGLAEHIGVPVQRVNEIVRGKRGVTPETAWLFSEAFSTTLSFGLICNPSTTYRQTGQITMLSHWLLACNKVLLSDSLYAVRLAIGFANFTQAAWLQVCRRVRR